MYWVIIMSLIIANVYMHYIQKIPSNPYSKNTKAKRANAEVYLMAMTTSHYTKIT